MRHNMGIHPSSVRIGTEVKFASHLKQSSCGKSCRNDPHLLFHTHTEPGL